MAKKRYDIIVPSDYEIKPKELEAARILATHFQANVHILSPSKGFMEKTPDFAITGCNYELKTPLTSNIRSISNIIHLATKQSENVVIDIRKSKITEKRMSQVCNERLKSLKKLKRIVLIVKNKKVLEFSK